MRLSWMVYPAALRFRGADFDGDFAMPSKESLCCIEHMFGMARCKIDWVRVLAYRDEGHTLAECQRQFGFHADAWYKAIRRGTIVPGPAARHGGQLQYDWNAVARYYDAGHSYRECRERFGFAYDSWGRAVRRGDIRPREQRWTLEHILATSKSRWTIKRRLLEAGILVNQCEECGISEWRGNPLVIQIDHRNGVNDDHRVENLRMLCPNCHSQTETYGARNRKLKRSLISFLIIEKTNPGSVNGRRGASEVLNVGSSPAPGVFFLALSSRGLGRRPLTAVTRVRIPLGLPKGPRSRAYRRSPASAVGYIDNRHPLLV